MEINQLPAEDEGRLGKGCKEVPSGQGGRSLCERRGPADMSPSHTTFSPLSCFPASTQYFLFEFHETRLRLQDLLLEITVRGVG